MHAARKRARERKWQRIEILLLYCVVVCSLTLIHSETNAMDISVFAEPNAQTYINETNPKAVTHTHTHTEKESERKRGGDKEGKRKTRTQTYVTAMVQARWKRSVAILNVAGAVAFLPHSLPSKLSLLTIKTSSLTRNVPQSSFSVAIPILLSFHWRYHVG